MFISIVKLDFVSHWLEGEFDYVTRYTPYICLTDLFSFLSTSFEEEVKGMNYG